MRNRTAQYHRMESAGPQNIPDIFPPPAQEPQVLDPLDRTSDIGIYAPWGLRTGGDQGCRFTRSKGFLSYRGDHFIRAHHIGETQEVA